MKPQRYVAVLPLPRAGERCAPIEKAVRPLPGFRALSFDGGVLLIGDDTRLLSRDGSHLLGTLFDGIGTLVRDNAVAQLTPDGLLERHWGGYILIERDSACCASIFRDPSGAVPCYYRVEADHVVIASDLALLMRAADRGPAINWSIVSALLLAIQYRSYKTALDGIFELLPGERLRIGACGVATDTIWSPWQFALPSERITDPEAASDVVRTAVNLSIAGWRSVIPHPLVSVSGGLDSSIVTACLASHGISFDCFTLATETPIGDERDFARILADDLNVPLHEAMFDVSSIDFARTAGAHLPRPGTRAFLQVTDAVSLRLMAAVGADGFFHGGGGDNVFCSIRSVAPILDRLLTGSGTKAIWSTTHDLAKLTGADLWSIAAAVFARLMRSRRAYRWPLDTRLLTQEAFHGAELGFDHPWLQAPSQALPGTVAHVANLLAIQNYLEGSERERTAVSIAPLMAQPVMEACLRIPSWLWIADGVDRAIARRAFAPDLPEMIVNRRQKGTPGSVAAELFETRGAEIREWLLDGMMAEAGLIDRAQVERALAQRQATGSMAYARIMTFCDFEAWCRSVGERRVEGNGSAFV